MTPALKETAPMSTLDHALRLSRQGFHVFPIIEGGRTPAIIGFPQRATRDEAQIRAWWVEHDPVLGVDREHGYNVGIYTGRFGDDKALLVVDVDTKKGKSGNASLDYLDMMEGVPATLTATTPSGGRHLFYVVDEPLKTGVNVLGNGLDTRSGGGYVVGAGSVTDSGAYRWTDEGEPRPAPGWMAAKVGKTVKHDNSGTAQVVELLDTQPAISRATEYLTRIAPVAVEGTGGDMTTFKVAAAVKDQGVSELTALELMWTHWNHRCAPPWSYEQLALKVSNAYHYGTAAVGSKAADASMFEPVPGNSPGTHDELFPDPEAPPQRTVADLGLEDIEDVGESDLLPDEWVLGDVLCKGYVTALVSPGGVGKTALEIAVAGAVATGSGKVLDLKVHEAGNVLIFNNEDDNGILRKRWHALKRLHELKGIPNRVIIKGGASRPVKLAKIGNDGMVRATDDVRLVKEAIRECEAKVVVFDPVVEFHGCDENNNVHMAAMMGIIRSIAIDCNVAILVVHHTRKPPQADSAGSRGSMDSARGAGAFGGNVRRAFTLSEMTEDEAKRFCIKDTDRFDYIVLDDAKGNHVRRSAAGRWFKKEGVRIATMEEVVAIRPVHDGELKDRNADVARVVGEELVEIAAGDPEIGFNAALTTLVGRAMFSDKASDSGKPKTAFVEQVEAAFEKPVKVGGYEIRLVEKAVKGSNAKKWFEIELMEGANGIFD